LISTGSDHYYRKRRQEVGAADCGETGSSVFYTGTVPNQQIVPAVLWAFGFLRRKRFFCGGWNSIYSRAANDVIRDEVVALGGQVVAEQYVLSGNTGVIRFVRTIALSEPEVIFNSLLGDTNLDKIFLGTIPIMSFASTSYRL
jgi:ABC-type branched-subunit amino acid transport system substrate-binding protein